MNEMVELIRAWLSGHPVGIILTLIIVPLLIWVAKVIGQEWLSHWFQNRLTGLVQLDAEVWVYPDNDYEFMFTFRNSSKVTAKLRKIEVVKPKKIEVAWLKKPMDRLQSISYLGKPGNSSVHNPVLNVEPGEQGTFTMAARISKKNAKCIKLCATVYFSGKVKAVSLKQVVPLVDAIPTRGHAKA